MASLSKNGVELGRIHRLWHTDAHFSNGKILRNAGFGWKIHSTVKAHIDPKAYFEARKQSQTANKATKPALAALGEFLHHIPLGRRWKLKAALDLLGPDEPDGIHSHVCDYEYTFEFDEILALCKLYRAAHTEMQQLKESQNG